MLPSNRLGDVESPSVQWGRRFRHFAFWFISVFYIQNGRSFALAVWE